MFPSILAEDVFSLARGEACPTLAFIGDVAPDGQLSNGQIKMMTASAQRITYDQADDVLAGGLRAVPHKGEWKALVRVRAHLLSSGFLIRVGALSLHVACRKFACSCRLAAIPTTRSTAPPWVS